MRALLFGDGTQQYDIIYVDWKNGTASIQHNAAVLRNVLVWVNAQKQANSSQHIAGITALVLLVNQMPYAPAGD